VPISVTRERLAERIRHARGHAMSSLDRHTDYGSTPFTEAGIGRDPFAVFADWLRAAEEAEVGAVLRVSAVAGILGELW